MTVIPDLSFDLEEYKSRIDKVKQLMEECGIDVLVIHHFPNICYLSGYQSWNTADYYAFIVPMKSEPVLVLWDSERSNAKLTSWVSQLRTFPTRGDPVGITIEILKELSMAKGRIGIELGTPYLNARVYSQIANSFPQATFIDCSELVQEVRAIKSPQEIAYIRKAAVITTTGIEAAVEMAKVARYDQEIASSAYHALISNGSQYMCIPPVICAGQLSGIPHSTHRGIRLAGGDTVLLEMSACVHRYNAPLMRAVVLGSPNEIITRMSDSILDTLNKIIE